MCRFVMLSLGLLVAAAAPGTGCGLNLGDAPFYCNKGVPACPDGYECRGQICVKAGSCPETLPECKPAANCGNGKCDPDENSANCPADCPAAVCGNGKCETGETNALCPADCPVTNCGNGKCEVGESNASCPADCPAAVCGNGKCESGETSASCPADCAVSACGNGKCDLGETSTTCPADCPPVCGNGKCEIGETATSCKADCATTACGNGKCDAGETATSCPADCGGCTADQTKCENTDTLKYCEANVWKSGTCETLCKQGGFDYGAGCAYSSSKAKDVCTCGKFGVFGDVCDNTQKCGTTLVCASFTTGKGFCTKYCTTPNAKCSGAPVFTLASCILQVSGKDVCGFECDGLWTDCPTGLKCDMINGICKP